jgi:AmmeMemoRadiSam system protein B
VTWVKEINDKRIVDALLGQELDRALELARREQSACSVGGAVAAARFASQAGAEVGELLEYKTSYDVYPGPSFVGYAGIIFPSSGERPR